MNADQLRELIDRLRRTAELYGRLLQAALDAATELERKR